MVLIQPRAVLISVALVIIKEDAEVLPPEVMLISMDVGEPTLLLFEGEHRFGKGKITHGEMRPCKRYSTGWVSNSPKI